MAERVEDKVQKRFQELLRQRGWYTIKTIGNMYQSGLPDIMAWHKSYGFRMIEIKTPRGRFTPAQEREFHQISAHGGQVWVLVGDLPLNDLHLSLEIEKLKSKGNWYQYI